MNYQDDETASDQRKKKSGKLQLFIRFLLDTFRDHPLISIGITITLSISITFVFVTDSDPSLPDITYPASCLYHGTGSQFDVTSQPDETPQADCILIVEWWIPSAPQPCGIIVTTEKPIIPEDAIGTWWLVNENRVQSHIQEFLAKNDYCEVSNMLEL